MTGLLTREKEGAGLFVLRFSFQMHPSDKDTCPLRNKCRPCPRLLVDLSVCQETSGVERKIPPMPLLFVSHPLTTPTHTDLCTGHL